MSCPFDYFVVLAGMRTGSNLLEEQLAAMPGLRCHGELFNPHFFGKPDQNTQWGLSMQARDADPARAIGAMRQSGDGLHGFRLFHDHNSRAIDAVLANKKAAKIILTRRPVDSYVSLKIARKTGQWWLGDLTSARKAKVPFDAQEYADFLNELANFQSKVTHSLQVTGQTAFHIEYDDLSDEDVLAGLGAFLASDGPPDPAKVHAKVQNPTPVYSRLTNPKVAEEALRSLSTPDIERLHIYEPDRGPGLRYFRACKSAPMLYMPIRGAGVDPVPGWLKELDPTGEIESGMTQKDLRRWKRTMGAHRSFTILRHPLPRAHDAFCRHILPIDAENYSDIRAALIQTYDVPLPTNWPDRDWTLAKHREAFLEFLQFLMGNLGGQTALRVDNSWATQSVLLQAIGQFAVPDRVVREPDMAAALVGLAAEVGVTAPKGPIAFHTDTPFPLSEVVTSEIEKAAEAAYRRDFVMFGFESWSAA